MKFLVLNVLLFLLLPIIFFTPYYFLSSEPGSVITYMQHLITDISENIGFLIVQTIVLVACIWFFAEVPVRLIIEKNRNKFWTSFVFINILWIVLFISCSISSGVINSIKYGWEGFESSVTSWIIYGLILWLMFAIVSGLILSPFIGKEIKRRWVDKHEPSVELI